MIFGMRLADGVRLSQIDASNRGDHAHLTAGDLCLYLYEYTSGHDYKFSATNNLISNLKKKPSQSALPGYRHKARTIAECAAVLGQTLNNGWLRAATLVPVPCSKSADHPDFDNRMEQICRQIAPEVDVRNMVRQTQSTEASHEAGAGPRLTIDQLLAIYAIDETTVAPPPRSIGIVDDVLTAGTHYRAMHSILTARFPDVPIVGVFIARRVFPNAFGRSADGAMSDRLDLIAAEPRPPNIFEPAASDRRGSP